MIIVSHVQAKFSIAKGLGELSFFSPDPLDSAGCEVARCSVVRDAVIPATGSIAIARTLHAAPGRDNERETPQIMSFKKARITCMHVKMCAASGHQWAMRARRQGSAWHSYVQCE